MRSRLIKERTALVNQIRGLLAERGIVIAQGITRLRKQLPVIVEDVENELTPLSREVMRELSEELVALDERVTRADALVQRVFTQSAACQKLAQVEGIGPVVATALVAAVGNATGVCQWPTSRGVVRVSAAATFHGGQGAPAGD